MVTAELKKKEWTTSEGHGCDHYLTLHFDTSLVDADFDLVWRDYPTVGKSWNQ